MNWNFNSLTTRGILVFFCSILQNSCIKNVNIIAETLDYEKLESGQYGILKFIYVLYSY